MPNLRSPRLSVAALTSFALMRTPQEAAALLAGGCGCADDSLASSREALAASETPAVVGALWEGVIGVEGELTGDGRYIESNALFWENLPIPIRYAPVDTGGHNGAEVVGRILTVERRPDGTIWGTGDFDGGSEVGREAIRQVDGALTRGVSMDLDSVAFEIRVAREVLDEMPEESLPDGDADGRVTVYTGKPDDEVMVMTSARVRAATIVSIPAFSRANIDLTGGMAALALESRPIEGGVPEGAVCSMEGCTNPPTLEVIDTDNPDGAALLYCEEHAAEVVAASEAETGGEDASEDAGPVGGNLVAGAFPVSPASEWFRDPTLTEPTPLTITEDGRVFGHLAVWGTCHTAYPGQCVEPPHSPSNYAYFRTGAVLTSEGTEVATGVLTLDTLHAEGNLSAARTLAHYEHTGRGAADVAVGEDVHGIWVAGALRPGLSDEKVRALRASPLSGDWRRIGAGLELVAALAVNVPGFPIPRPQGLVASGVMQALVASGMLAPRKVLAPGTPGALSTEDLRWLKRLATREKAETKDRVKTAADELAATLRTSRAAALAAKVLA